MKLKASFSSMKAVWLTDGITSVSTTAPQNNYTVGIQLLHEISLLEYF